MRGDGFPGGGCRGFRGRLRGGGLFVVYTFFIRGE